MNIESRIANTESVAKEYGIDVRALYAVCVDFENGGDCAFVILDESKQQVTPTVAYELVGGESVRHTNIEIDGRTYEIDTTITSEPIGDGVEQPLVGVVIDDDDGDNYDGLWVYEGNFWDIGGREVFPEIGKDHKDTVTLSGLDLAKRIAIAEQIPGWYTPSNQGAPCVITFRKLED